VAGRFSYNGKGARKKMEILGRSTISLKEFASRWKLSVSRATIWVSKGPTETDVIRGPKGFIYEDSRYGLIHHSSEKYCKYDGRYNTGHPCYFNPTGYPGELEAFSTQQILIHKLGIYLWNVPKLSLQEYERAIGA
jgi:hypothetical protein